MCFPYILVCSPYVFIIEVSIIKNMTVRTPDLILEIKTFNFKNNHNQQRLI